MRRGYGWRYPGLITCFLLIIPAANACGVCVWAMHWNYIPPIYEWSIILPAWFLISSIMASRSGVDIAFLPKPLKGILYLCFAFLLAAQFGPTLLVLLVVPFVRGLYGLLNRHDRTAWPPVFAKRFAWLTTSVGILMLVALGHQLWLRSHMTPVDKIMKWQGTAFSRVFEDQLRKQEPDSIPEYRRLLIDGPTFHKPLGAQRLAEIGDPAIDLPLMGAALAKIEVEKRSYEQMPGLSIESDMAGKRIRDSIAKMEARCGIEPRKKPDPTPKPKSSGRPH